MTPQQNNFKTMLKLYRSVMSKTQRKRTRSRALRPITYPIGIERAYARVARDRTSVFIERTKPVVDAFIRAYVVRTDSVESDLDALLTQLENELTLMYGVNAVSSGALGRALSDIAERILGTNSAYMQRQFKVIAGTPLTIDAPWWPETKDLWENQNYNLLKGLGNEYVSKVNNIIINGLQNGQTVDELAASIQKVADNLTGPRAKLIARDQVGKLNSLVAKAQSQLIGIQTYWWVTAGDERVRGNPSGPFKRAIPSHYIMSDLLMSWDNPNVYSDDLGKTWKQKTAKMEPLHVGMAINCRCTAAPSWNNYLLEIDKTFQGDTL